LLKLQAAGNLRVWVEGGAVKLDVYRPLYEEPIKQKVTWERAREIVELGGLDDHDCIAGHIRRELHMPGKGKGPHREGVDKTVGNAENKTAAAQIARGGR
jgi:hypothetical protein